MAAVVRVGAVTHCLADYITVVSLQVLVTPGAVGGQCRPGVGQDLGIIEIASGIAHGQMGPAVSAQLQAGRLYLSSRIEYARFVFVQLLFSVASIHLTMGSLFPLNSKILFIVTSSSLKPEIPYSSSSSTYKL